MTDLKSRQLSLARTHPFQVNRHCAYSSVFDCMVIELDSSTTFNYHINTDLDADPFRVIGGTLYPGLIRLS